VKTTRLTYEQVDKLLDPFAMASDENSGVDGIEDLDTTLDSLRRLDWASEQRLQWRKDGGSLESIGPYELPDMQVKARPSVDEPDGWAVNVVARERYTASRIVTELMLAANEAIAMYGEANGIPMPYRCQEMDEVSEEEIESTPEGPCRAWLAIRSTTKSQISPTPRPHAGLGLDVYAQATSPIRRYADLALHHQLKAHLRGDELPFPDGIEGDDGVRRASAILRLAQDGGEISRQLERPANDYWLREFLRRRGASPTEALVLSSDRWKEDRYKMLLPELGAIITYESNRPLAIGSQIDMPSSSLAEFV
jgi:exoribonuclease-2